MDVCHSQDLVPGVFAFGVEEAQQKRLCSCQTQKQLHSLTGGSRLCIGA